jgi:DNA polymerase-3 subunit gamma/tau
MPDRIPMSPPFSSRFPGARVTDVRIAAAEEDLAPSALSPTEDGDILPEDIEPEDSAD